MDDNIKNMLSILLFRIRKLSITGPPGCDLHMGEVFSLAAIERNNEKCGQNVLFDELKLKMAVTKSAISQIVNGLEKKGYVRREIDVRDRRKFRLLITRSGREKLRVMKEHFNTALEDIIARFGEENTRQMVFLTSSFLDIFEEMKREGSLTENREKESQF